MKLTEKSSQEKPFLDTKLIILCVVSYNVEVNVYKSVKIMAFVERKQAIYDKNRHLVNLRGIVSKVDL